MWHLYHRDMKHAVDDNTNVDFELIKTMHPTPAMCGTPTQLAKQQLESVRGLTKEVFLVSLVGWCDAQVREWAIAIRCAEVSETR